MKYLYFIKPYFCFCLLLLSYCQSQGSISRQMRELIFHETKGNPSANRSDNPEPISFFEIPEKHLYPLISPQTPSSLISVFRYYKNNEPYVRWPIHPEDKVYYFDLKTYFRNKLKLSLNPIDGFIGYQSASRTYYLQAPEHPFSFGIKASTNRTGGPWSFEKKHTSSEARDGRLASDYLSWVQSLTPFKNLIVLPEPLAWAIPEVDQSFIVRDLSPLNLNSDLIYLPAFTLFHEEIGVYLAKINGSLDPSEYWENHYVIPLARAMAELAIKAGVQPDSPHSQNFLIEFDKNFVPTGRIVLRDLSDLFFNKAFLEAIHPNPKEFINTHSQTDRFINGFMSGFAPVHGSPPPTWFNPSIFYRWIGQFDEEYEKQIHLLTGLSSDYLLAQSSNISIDRYTKKWQVSKKAFHFWIQLHRLKNSSLSDCEKALE